jgi:hypothetical protein
MSSRAILKKLSSGLPTTTAFFSLAYSSDSAVPVAVLLQRHELSTFHKAPKCGVEARVSKAFSQVSDQHDLWRILGEARSTEVLV